MRADSAAEALECARFIDFEGRQIYTVTHAPSRPRRGAVLICGPFGVERERAYLTHVSWARTLAAHGFQVLRFDYRGSGESSGTFESMTLAHWREDAARCAAELSASADGGALVLQGTRLGALVAAELFASGIGDGLLLWAPPVSADALLREALRHNLIARRLADREAPPVTREQLIAALEAGESVNVDGYTWTRALWREAQGHPLLVPAAAETRPWLALEVRAHGATGSAPSSRRCTELVDADTFWQSSSPLLRPRSQGFFQASLRWLGDHERWRARSD